MTRTCQVTETTVTGKAPKESYASKEKYEVKSENTPDTDKESSEQKKCPANHWRGERWWSKHRDGVRIHFNDGRFDVNLDGSFRNTANAQLCERQKDGIRDTIALVVAGPCQCGISAVAKKGYPSQSRLNG